ncbi:hypothetical protein CALCODRAFT_368210 [Calocera cornea HHB12733]|uniref:BZIP domain-containing protein n=1 Tax=Calocera cornea HHB12733 TaxID=1353952 RepID=A0A165EJA6_9BASI|nr:hypothetical protein CALCODRAFT_368210 [Calocera cornea HHB12733]
MSYRSSGPPQDSPSPGERGGDRPERSRNAKAQAKHRAKRAAYVKGLEDDVGRLKAQLEAVMTQRGLSAMAGSSHGPMPMGSELEGRRSQELELELARVRSENAALRAQLQRTGVSISHMDMYGGMDRPHSGSYQQRPHMDMHGVYPHPPRSGSASSNSESSISPAVQQPPPPMLSRSHNQAGQVQPSQESMASSSASIPFYLLPLPPNHQFNSLLIACARASSPQPSSSTAQSSISPLTPPGDLQGTPQSLHTSSDGRGHNHPSPPLLPSPPSAFGDIGNNQNLPLSDDRAPLREFLPQQLSRGDSQAIYQPGPYDHLTPSLHSYQANTPPSTLPPICAIQ